MARSCGIHIDQRHFHLVALDGSAKKHKLLARASGTIPAGEDPVNAVASQLRAIIKSNKLNIESVGLAVDSGLAAFRSLVVPFDDAEKTEQIIKFEIESDLPQWNIDDVIVDFHVLYSTPGVESHLLVTALPKARLERQLLACERGSLEADEAELDCTALFNAASAANVVGADSAQMLVYVGDSTTSVVVVDGGKLVSMRAIRTGALPPGQFRFAQTASEDTVEGEPAQASEDLAQADEAVEANADFAIVDEPPAALISGNAARIRRELGRTLEAAQTEFEVQAIYLSGHRLAGLDAEDLHEVPFRQLEVLPADEEHGATDALLTVAYGAALRALGGGQLRSHLRREELRFTGTFERLELPLAVLGLLLCTLLGVMSIVLHKQIGWRDQGTLEEPGDMQLWLSKGVQTLLGDASEGIPARLNDAPDKVRDYALAAVAGEKDTISKFKQIRFVNQLLSDEIKVLKRQVGEITDEVPPQSALQGGLLVLTTLYALQEELGQFSILNFSANYERGTGVSNEDRVVVTLDMDFFADSEGQASRNFDTFRSKIQGEAWCNKFEDKKSDPFAENGGGLAYRGLVIELDVAKYLANELASRLAAQKEAS